MVWVLKGTPCPAGMTHDPPSLRSLLLSENTCVLCSPSEVSKPPGPARFRVLLWGLFLGALGFPIGVQGLELSTRRPIACSHGFCHLQLQQSQTVLEAAILALIASLVPKALNTKCVTETPKQGLTMFDDCRSSDMPQHLTKP